MWTEPTINKLFPGGEDIHEESFAVGFDLGAASVSVGRTHGATERIGVAWDPNFA